MNAVAMLRPGGTLAVVDFCLSAAQPALQSRFLKRWFAHDGVHLSLEHVPALCAVLPERQCVQCFTSISYLPFLRVPYYLFLSTRQDQDRQAA